MDRLELLNRILASCKGRVVADITVSEVKEWEVVMIKFMDGKQMALRTCDSDGYQSWLEVAGVQS